MDGKIGLCERQHFHHTKKFRMIIGPKLDRVNRPLELKSDFISIEKPDQVLIAIILFLMKTIFVSEKTIAYPLSKLTFQNHGGCFKCLLSTGIILHMTILKIFLKVDSIGRDCTTSNGKYQVIDQCFSSRRG